MHSDKAGHEMPLAWKGRNVRPCLHHSPPALTAQHSAWDGVERGRERGGRGMTECRTIPIVSKTCGTHEMLVSPDTYPLIVDGGPP